ncbi:AAA family ATPase [Brevibacillus agri]|uniref:AAA family ATPase n=1 Tax=Brevibacillus agri TaxID=51101 RepID=UPI002867D6D4|nr:AAA family ATPase [Brevibacillus agri]MED1642316.1 AAA family ATPase [Brevibacillus agri]MED1657630.1 AAA family ATPase [Brevibacillus agri]MED1689389.1 AAA family ATPase [Brevibacillus agri]MED1694471.1 AAA family ATPase [Brevibacillus agri]MED1696790.1 AAA family ATPase [Brevibacillus agri]
MDDRAKAALEKLGSLPGMFVVKEQVEQMIQFAKISKLRTSQGLKALPQSNHMIFTGNPGTGKTTAARLIGEAFTALGMLKSDQEEPPFVEVHHADVTHPHVGQAERTIKAKFKEARGGVLFIDEAYAFVAGETSHMTGDKVIAAIVQLMEDMRDEIVVIAAGYPQNMEEFLNENPGLRSRFPTTINFPDYEVSDLVQIAAYLCVEREYTMSKPYVDMLAARLLEEKQKPGFGNARTVRNIIEQSIRRQAARVAQMAAPSRAELVLLTEFDMPPSENRVTEKEMLLRSLGSLQERLREIERREILFGPMN